MPKELESFENQNNVEKKRRKRIPQIDIFSRLNLQDTNSEEYRSLSESEMPYFANFYQILSKNDSVLGLGIGFIKKSPQFTFVMRAEEDKEEVQTAHYVTVNALEEFNSELEKANLEEFHAWYSNTKLSFEETVEGLINKKPDLKNPLYGLNEALGLHEMKYLVFVKFE